MAHPWGGGDEFSIATGLVVLSVGLAARQKNRTRERTALLLANGMAVGPLLLIMASPFPQLVGWNIDLLETAINEGRVTIFWAAAYATIHLLLDVF